MKTTSILDKKAIAAENASPFETLALSIDPEGAEHLMGTLTNMYSKPLEAVFREYVSNALDSHLKCGQTKPIRVNITYKSGQWVLIVQDFGVGMSRDDVANVYSKYAASTKRDSNTQIGAFGLGAKSALAIANRFDVVSIKDGTRLEFFIEKNSRGVGVIHFVSEKATKEANGVTVTIPLAEDKAKSLNEFATKPNGFFSTWNPDLVIYNNAPLNLSGNVYNPEQFVTLTSGLQTLGWLRLPQSDNPPSVYLSQAAAVAIAGIRYNVERDGGNDTVNGILAKVATGDTYTFFTSLADTGFSIVINLPIGSVDLTPSREDIMLSAKTERTLKAAFEELVDEIKRAMASRMNKLNYADAFAFHIRNAAALGVQNTHVKPMYGSHLITTYNPGIKDTYGVLYKNKPIPAVYSGETEILALEAANASTWDNDGWEKVPNINLVRIFRGLSRDSTNNLVKSKGHYKAIVVYGAENTEENLAIIKRNARSYTTARHDNKYPSVFFIPENEKPEDKWLNAVAEVISIAELEKVGKSYRSQIAKEAAEGRGPSKKRPAAIHYGLQLQDGGSVAYRKYSAEEIAEAEQVVVVDFDPSMNHYSNYRSATRNEGAAFWDAFAESMDNKDAKTPAHVDTIYTILGNAFPDALIIVLPKTRSINPIIKANNNAKTIREAISDRIQEIKKTPNEWKKLKAIAESPVTATGYWSLPSKVSVGDHLSNVKDSFTREVFSEIAARGEYLNLIVAGRIFIVLTTPKYNTSDYKAIREVFAEDAKVKENGWGSKYRYLNDLAQSGNANRDAAIFVNLVNAVDSSI